MENSEYQNIFANEQSHGWYTGMRELSVGLLKNYLPKSKKLRILDAGCGTGAMMQSLKSFGSVTGIDNSPLAVHFSRDRKAGLVKRQTIEKIAFPPNTFDLVTNFDVLYIDSVNPFKAVSEFNRVLKKNGWLFVRVPAFNFLAGRHDIVVHSGRRFVKRQLVNLLKETNFKIEFVSYVNIFLFLPTLFKRAIWERFFIEKPSSDIGPLPFVVSKLVHFLLSLEAKIMLFVPLPFGVSLLALARKK